jgi:hypothetical protein
VPQERGDRRLGERPPKRHPSRFVPETFVTSIQTLYSLSKEGAGIAGPLVTALTAATIEAAEEHAARSRGGRLATPLLAVLDEAANVCRWKDLPDLYSHYGSRGIPIVAVRADPRVAGERIVRISNEFRLQETEEYTVEVRKMLYNWRLVIRPPRQQIEITHGYYYFGTDLEALVRAIAAGLEWVGPVHTAPRGFDNQAFDWRAAFRPPKT